jgi:hypothetical protein
MFLKSASPIPIIIIDNGKSAEAIISSIEAYISFVYPSVKIINIK